MTIDEIRSKLKGFKDIINRYNELNSKLSYLTDKIKNSKTDLLSKLNSNGFSKSEDLLAEIKRLEGLTPELNSLKIELNGINYKIGELEGKIDYIEQLITSKKNRILDLTSEYSLIEECHTILINLQKLLKKEAVEQIEKFVNDSLKYIFSIDFNFKIEFIEKGNYVNAEFVLTDFNGESKNLVESFGGGIIDAFSVILRLVSIELQNPSNNGPVILDEIGKFISSDYQARFSDFLRQWSERFNRQILLISHKQEAVEFANLVIKINKQSDKSEVTYL